MTLKTPFWTVESSDVMDDVELNFCWKLTKNIPEVLSTPIMIDISSAAPVEKQIINPLLHMLLLDHDIFFF